MLISSRDARPALTAEEARRIAEHAHAGRLDVTDPAIRDIVDHANRLLVHAQLWGESTSEHPHHTGRLIVIGGALFLGLWVAGLLVPLLAHVGI